MCVSVWAEIQFFNMNIFSVWCDKNHVLISDSKHTKGDGGEDKEV